jgi:hypothetical protein
MICLSRHGLVPPFSYFESLDCSHEADSGLAILDCAIIELDDCALSPIGQPCVVTSQLDCRWSSGINFANFT